MKRTLSLSMLLAALSGGACDFAPICPPNSAYNNSTRRCTVQDAARPAPPDAGGGGASDSGALDSGAPDGATSDSGAADSGALDSGSDAR